jgi:hypothetical protein
MMCEKIKLGYWLGGKGFDCPSAAVQLPAASRQGEPPMGLMFYGSTTNFIVQYDSTFTGGAGQPDGAALAQGVLDYCEYDLVRLSMLFGIMLSSPHLPITVNLVPGDGGASNDTVRTITCYCNANTLPLSALVVAEEVEIFMTVQAKGWNPRWSNGEALSRVCAQILYPSQAWLFQTGQSWLSATPRPDWVDSVEHTDQHFASIGCGTLFLNYLAYQLNFSWPDIIAAGAPNTSTLAETATILGVTNAWVNFTNLFTIYLPSGILPSNAQTSYGPEATDDPFPLGPLTAPVPTLYMRHNIADDGTSHTGSLSDSPDIILKNNPVTTPQATYSTAASIASDTESDLVVLTGQANYVYLRVWNRGTTDASNVFATLYWSPPSTLVTPNMWTLVGSALYPVVPAGSVVEVSIPGITWPADQLPGAGHDCFVATVGNADAPAPNPLSFANFNDFENYIYANNNITWRNFNVDFLPFSFGLPLHFGGFMPLRFLIAGAWDAPRAFVLETHAELPEGSQIALQVPHWIGRGLQPAYPKMEELEDAETDPENRRRLRIPVSRFGRQSLGRVELPAGTTAASHMLIQIPENQHKEPLKIYIRQLYEGREVGRITWLLLPKRRSA